MFHLPAALLVLAVLVVLAYANSFHAAWHFDDTTNITENPYIQITSLSLPSLLKAMVQDRRQNRPFSNLTFALNYYFNDERVWGYHLFNVALHLLSTWAVFGLLRLTFRRTSLPEDRRDLAAFFAAAVWAVHPIHTQAVTYIVQRQTVMASALAGRLRGLPLRAGSRGPSPKTLALCPGRPVLLSCRRFQGNCAGAPDLDPDL